MIEVTVGSIGTQKMHLTCPGRIGILSLLGNICVQSLNMSKVCYIEQRLKEGVMGRDNSVCV